MLQMSQSDFLDRNYERRQQAPQRSKLDPDVQELLDDNVHALRQDIWETGR